MMRTLLMAAASAVLLMAAPALAQDPHHPADPAVTPAPAAALTDAEMHDMCKAVMGDQMAPKAAPHDHGRDKTGAPTWPGGKPLSKAEMEAMHNKCAAMMTPASAPTAPAPTPQ